MKILFQGDSITDGARLKPVEKRWDKNHQIGHSYAYIVSAKLGFEDPHKYEFVNRGISGNDIFCLENRWEEDAIEVDPDILSILVGINGNGRTDDGRYVGDFDANLAAHEAGYRRILDRSLKKNPSLKIIIIESFVLPVGVFKADYEDFYAKLTKICEATARIASDYGAVFIPMQEEIERLAKESGDPSLWLWDGIHPTERCHWLLANRWLDAAAQFLK